MDSAVCLAVAKSRGFDCYTLAFDYGQRHVIELCAAAEISKVLGATAHYLQRVPLRGASALLSDNVPLAKGRTPDAMAKDGIPATYVPARNTVFLSFAIALAEILGASHIFIGVNRLDFAGYPDCRGAYINAMENVGRLATASPIVAHLEICTPLIDMTKAQIVQLGASMAVPFGLTLSCYDPDTAGQPCGQCDACVLRAQGFLDAGIEDVPLALHSYSASEA